MRRLGAEPLRWADRMTSYAISYQSEAKFGLRDCNLSSMYSQSFQKCCMCSVAARANFQCRTLTHCKLKLFHKLLAMICSCKIIANSSRWRLHKRPVLTNKFDNLSLAVSRTSGTIWGCVICKLHDPPSLPCRLRWTSFIQHMVNKFSFRKSFIPHLNHNTLVYNQGDLSLKKMSSVVGHSVLRNMLYDHARKFASRNWIPLNKTFYLEKNDYFEKEDSIISLVFCCYPYDKITLSA